MSMLKLRDARVWAIVATVFYAQWHTGLATDDFVFLSQAQKSSLALNLWPDVYFSVPLLHYTHALAYFLFDEHLWAYDLLKAAYLALALLAAWRFLAVFYGPGRAMLGAMLVFFSPLHDAATLWLTGQYLTLSLGFYLLAYVKAHEQRDGQAFALAACGSFCSYGSPPLAAGLALMFVLQKRWKAAAMLLVPNLIYVAFYAYTSAVMKVGIKRLPEEFHVGVLAKNYLAQIASFLDASIGPSAWLKYALSLASLSWLSLVVAVGLAVWLWRTPVESVSESAGTDRRILLAGGSAIVALSFGIFALNGKYPQVAFNLGDRVMIYGDLLVAILLVNFVRRRYALTAIVVVVVAAFLGIGDHWKRWNDTVQASVAQIRALPVPEQAGSVVFVSGLQYSPLGSMTHIDHFTASYVVREVFAIARRGRQEIQTTSFNPRLRLEADSLVDIKYGDRIPIGRTILVYDAGTNTLADIPRERIEARLSGLPPELRHWTQLIGPGVMRDAILWFMPRLKYAYPA